MEPLEYLRVLKRRWLLVALAVVAGLALAYAATPSATAPQSQTYQATHTLAVNPQASSQSLNLAQAALLARVGEVPRRAARQIGFEGPAAALAASATAVPDATTGTLAVTAKNTDPKLTERTADALATQLNSYLDEQNKAMRQQGLDEVQRRLDALKLQTAALDAQIANPRLLINRDQLTAERDALINQYRLTYDQYQQLASAPAPAPPFVTLEPAAAVLASDSTFRAPTTRFSRMALAGVLALILGAGVALLLERLDIRVRTKEGAEEAFGFPVVGEVPSIGRGRKHEIQTVTRPSSSFAEAYRVLRTLLLLVHGPLSRAKRGVAQTYSADGNEPIKVILVTSPGAAEGKTTSVAHLASALAETGRSVLVLSCDFRRPRIHKMFDVDEGLGLTDVLAGGPKAPTLKQVIRPTNVRGVRIVLSGTPVENPAELMVAGRKLLAETRQLADIVLIDTAPILVANDASELVPSCDAVLVVSRAGKTSREAAVRTAELLERVQAPVLGVLLVAAPQAPTSNRYYYYRYHVRTEGVLGWRRILRRRPPIIAAGSVVPPLVSEPSRSHEAAAPNEPAVPAEAAAPDRRDAGSTDPEMSMPDVPTRRPSIFDVERVRDRGRR